MCQVGGGFARKTAVTANSRRLLLVIVLFSVSGLGSCHKKSEHHSVTLTWQASPSTPEASVVGYNVYRRTTPETPYVRIATHLTVTTYEDHVVNSRTTYVYAVTAVDQQGRESSFSNVATAQVP
jgi:fibronectin type 3 domain-containing protein